MLIGREPAVQAMLLRQSAGAVFDNRHSTPASASWLNKLERCLCNITTERRRRGVFTSLPELEAAINEYAAHHNTPPQPFIGARSARDILQRPLQAHAR